MWKTVGLALFVFCLCGAGFAQEIGDHFTAGYTSARTYLNSDQGDFGPPLALLRTVPLTDVSDASSLLVFENEGVRHLLVGQSGMSSVSYHLLDPETGSLQWPAPVNFPAGGTLNYTPSYSNDIVILGAPATTTVRAIQVSTGIELWEDDTVGAASGRHPVLTNGLALYAGSDAVVAADPMIGPSPSFWRFAATTAEAPLSVFGQQAYFLNVPDRLRALDVATGALIWSSPALAGVNPNIISTEKYVFFNQPLNDSLRALRAADGAPVWESATGTLSDSPALALAYDRLFVFTSEDGDEGAGVSALNPESGAPLWEATETGTGIAFGLVVNNMVLYYHEASQRIRVRDAFSGKLLWSQPADEVRGLSAADGLLYVLFADRVDVYEPVHQIFFAHVADGGGQQTLVTLTSQADEPITGSVSFFDADGDPLLLEIEDFGPASDVPFTIPPRGSARVQTLGGLAARSGWARVTADGLLTGSSIFQFVDQEGNILNEAGVGDSRLTGASNVFVEIVRPPQLPRTLSTGVAVANPLGEPARVVYRLLEESGAEMGSTEWMLDPGAQLPRFVQDLFPDETIDDLRGTLIIESDVPVVVTALRTFAGLQLSSYPVGQ